uniref:Uncharacterized protein n=1 Tax=Anguilla anguilla TaxID=7936 RepID=A0A0E9WXY0_ANGAN
MLGSNISTSKTYLNQFSHMMHYSAWYLFNWNTLVRKYIHKLNVTSFEGAIFIFGFYKLCIIL